MLATYRQLLPTNRAVFTLLTGAESLAQTLSTVEICVRTAYRIARARARPKRPCSLQRMG